ncbi:MAG TPA: NFACT family protein [Pyrinomonadaceae bacterium]|nr:NFACT family protein [Pyrinomonadaceae bacterium]
MNIRTLQRIVAELSEKLADSHFGRVFQMTANRIVIEFDSLFTRLILIDVTPSRPLVFLTDLRLRDLKKNAIHPAAFTRALRQQLTGRRLTAISLVPNERILRLDLASDADETIGSDLALMIQLTGRSSNMFLVDNDDSILARSRQTQGEGQRPGDIYSPPLRPQGMADPIETPIDRLVADPQPSPSAVIDNYLSDIEERERFDSLARQVISALRAERKKIERQAAKLKQDLRDHGDAETLRRIGDLLLANVSAARREGGSVFLVDYFHPELQEVKVDVDANESLAQAAERYYKRSSKARNALSEITGRLKKLEIELKALDVKINKAETSIKERDKTAIAAYLRGSGQPSKMPRGPKTDPIDAVSRRFVSSDGFEIRVGKRAKDNDVLTFKIARALDLWLHAADYPGSHVIVRNPDRTEIPERTLIEAAKLAAFYSRGSSQPKAAVHYTQKKFVNKPKGSAPGLVSLSKSKTILVEPDKPSTGGKEAN